MEKLTEEDAVECSEGEWSNLRDISRHTISRLSVVLLCKHTTW